MELRDVDSLQDSRMSGIVPRADFLDLIDVATLCVQPHSIDRPEMQEVVYRLTRINMKGRGTQHDTELGGCEEALNISPSLDITSMGDTLGTSNQSYGIFEDSIGYGRGR